MDHSPLEIAEAIASSKKYQKHVIDQQEFSGLGDQRCGAPLPVDSRDEYAAHIVKVLTDIGTKGFEDKEGDLHFYHKETNTHVVYMKSSPSLGTCFRPTSDRYFDREWSDDCDRRGEWFRGRASENGGVERLLETIGRPMPERSAEPPVKKNAFALARERALNAPAVERDETKSRDRDRDR